MTQHTKGPLYVHEHQNPETLDYFWELVDDDLHGSVVFAEVYKEEDAHLFAAAPDLLAAVEHVLIASEDGGGMDDIDWNMLREAIKKATGGQ